MSKKDFIKSLKSKQTILSYAFLIIGAISIHISLKSLFSHGNSLIAFQFEKFETISLFITNYWLLFSVFTVFLVGAIFKGIVFKPSAASYMPVEIHFLKPALSFPNELFLAKLIKIAVKNLIYLLIVFLIFVNPFLDALEYTIILRAVLFTASYLLLLILMAFESLAFFIKSEVIYHYRIKNSIKLLLVTAFILVIGCTGIIAFGIPFLPTTIFINIFYVTLFGNSFLDLIIVLIFYLVAYFIVSFILLLIISHHYYLYIEDYNDLPGGSKFFPLKNKFPKIPPFLPRKFFSMFYKDIIVNLRTIYVQILILSFIVFSILYFTSSFVATLVFTASPIFNAPIELFIFTLLTFLLSPITIHSFSDDLICAWLIKTAPIDFKSVFNAKLAIYLILTLLSTAPIFILVISLAAQPILQTTLITLIIIESFLYITIGINISIVYSPDIPGKEFPFSGFVAYVVLFILVTIPLFLIFTVDFYNFKIFPIKLVASLVYASVIYSLILIISKDKFYQRVERS